MSKEALKIKVGCDPELFVKNPNTGMFVSAHGLIPGTKSHPHKVLNGAVQVDGNALEFNIEPASNRVEFLSNIKSVMQQMTSMVPGYNVVVEPVAYFEESYFNGLPDEAKELGCDPDFNAYTGEVNIRPNTTKPMRTAAGHIHIGWTEGVNPLDPGHFEDCREVVKQLDYYLGVWSLKWDRNSERRELYGKAGAFRPKPYGVEYRTLSNTWLLRDDLTEWVYDQTIRAVNDLYSGVNSEYKRGGNIAQAIIDQNIYAWGRHHKPSMFMNYPPPGTKDEAKKKTKVVEDMNGNLIRVEVEG